MSDGITEDVTYSHQSFSDWKKREIQTFLSLRSTKELVDELSRREGVKEYPVELEWAYTLHVMGKGHDVFTTNNGSAKIFVVID